ncbi:hypothetical protein Pcinc_023743 [Petrolisthes cinctipes]|uniref:Uncharacterized protein n=1 Tax=Petrolisthes cinctipes TaxID=88211 RepID=A0AAE1FDP6_PETCI|nr:hypothetical protein Pcinc_023733 [Petrolisthes cinctipes]KAK3871097.1 hypothetical protein Pcinc_023743 [Petrolisthes cinctipes]
MALPTPPLQDKPGHMVLPTPPQHDIDEYYTDELEMNSLLINNLKIQLYLTHLLNIDQQQYKKRGRKARQRLAITLRFMATREAYKRMALNFRVGANSISKLVLDTCEANKR